MPTPDRQTWGDLAQEAVDLDPSSPALLGFVRRHWDHIVDALKVVAQGAVPESEGVWVPKGSFVVLPVSADGRRRTFELMCGMMPAMKAIEEGRTVLNIEHGTAFPATSIRLHPESGTAIFGGEDDFVTIDAEGMVPVMLRYDDDEPSELRSLS